MEFNRTKNTAVNTTLGIIEKIISTVLPFVVRTIIIYRLGVEYTGLNSLFTTIMSLLSLADIGFNTAIQYLLYKPVAEDNYILINCLIRFLKKAYLIISAIILVVGASLIPALPYFVKDASYPPDINLYVLYIIFLTNSIFSYMFGAYYITIIEVYQKNSIRHFVTIIVEIVKYGLQIIVLLLTKNYYLYISFLPIFTLILNLCYVLIVKKYFSWIKPCGNLDTDTKKKLFKKLIVLFLHHLAAAITNTVDNIVISSMLGLTALGIYGNYQLIMTSITGIVLIIITTLRPIVGNHYKTSNDDEIHKLYNALHLLISIVMLWTTICMFCLYQPFITIWVGAKNLLPITTVLFICLFYYANINRLFMSSIYIDIEGLWNKTLVRQFIVAILNLVLDVILIKYLDILGIVLASFVSIYFVALPLDYFVGYKYVLKLKKFDFIIPEVINIIILGIVGSITFFSCYYIPLDGWPKLIANAVMCIIVPSLLLWLIFRKKTAYIYLKQHIRLLFSGKVDC